MSREKKRETLNLFFGLTKSEIVTLQNNLNNLSSILWDNYLSSILWGCSEIHWSIFNLRLGEEGERTGLEYQQKFIDFGGGEDENFLLKL